MVGAMVHVQDTVLEAVLIMLAKGPKSQVKIIYVMIVLLFVIVVVMGIVT
jgi:hypothetical protein